ncbi:MAG: hypothetical protein Q4D44_06750 [Eubacteriales bacterium]|nr:hypothetical protein [Eubacteriales bacterium]
MEDKQWKYKIRANKLPVILTLLMFAVFGGLTAWLHSTNNGAFIFTGLFSAILLALVIATSHRLAFYKVLVGKDGFYYQTGPSNGKFYNYAEVEKAWVNSGEAQNRAQQDFCNVEIPGIPVIRFQFFYADEKAVNYLIKKIETSACKEIPEDRKEKAEYLIDGKVFGKTRIVLAIVLLIVVTIIDAVIIKADGYAYLLVPGTVLAVVAIWLLIVRYLYFKIQIGENGFYYRTNPFNGQHYEYSEITNCREIKKVIRHRAVGRNGETVYYFYFEFTDVRGKTQKFQFEKPIHGYEVDVLKERIESTQNLK